MLPSFQHYSYPDLDPSLCVETGPNHVRWTGNQGELEVRIAGPQVIHLIYRGYIGPEFVEPLIRMSWSCLLFMGNFHAFADTWQASDYDRNTRRTVETWSKHWRSRILSYSILVRSPIVAMAMSVLSILVRGTIKIYRSPDEFAGALQERVARSKHRADAA